jgi:CHAT domain-containing protein
VLCLGFPVGSDFLLRDVRSDLGGPPPIVGEAATVSAVKGADFSRAGVLLLATHGLVGGDAISQLPAVVLTPDSLTAGDAGLLTTSDIAALDLDSIWLAVVAACSTAHAAPDSIDEGLSGLGLAFASAGAKALLLSYWDAEADATRTIIRGVFDRMTADPKLTLSRALENEMHDLQAKKYSTERWAPFVVIGDGTVTLPRQ